MLFFVISSPPIRATSVARWKSFPFRRWPQASGIRCPDRHAIAFSSLDFAIATWRVVACPTSFCQNAEKLSFRNKFEARWTNCKSSGISISSNNIPASSHTSFSCMDAWSWVFRSSKKSANLNGVTRFAEGTPCLIVIWVIDFCFFKISWEVWMMISSRKLYLVL